MKKPDSDIVHAYGVWVLRILLLAGAVVLAVFDKGEAYAACASALICTFFLL